MRQHKYDYDAFISHAVEDKIPIANELCARLEQAGLRIWYSGKELGVGDSIEKTIANGLHRSRYGIVILSPTYLSKNWTIREFYTLLAKEIEEHKVILPVLYNVTLDDLKQKDLMMADRFAVNADRGIDHVVDRLVAEIRKPKREKFKASWFSRIWMLLFLSLGINAAFLLKSFIPGPPQLIPTQSAGIQVSSPECTMKGHSCSCGHHGIHGLESMAASHPETQPVVVRAGQGKLTLTVVFEVADEAKTAPITVEKDEKMHRLNEVENFDHQTDLSFITVSNRQTEDLYANAAQ